MSCECYRIGGPFIAEDPNCPIHGYEAQAREKEEKAYRESEEEKQNELLARIIALEEKIDAMPQCTQPAPSVPECPYPCGWRNLLKHAIEDGAYLARSINEDEPVTENARTVTMRMVMRLRDLLMTINNAAPEAKP